MTTQALERLGMVIGSLRNFADVADHCVITEVVNSIPAMRLWAEELEEIRQSLAAGGGEIDWPREAKPAIDGDGWVAITRLVEHRMDEMQAKVWNSCRAACIAAYKRADQHPKPAQVDEAISDALRSMIEEYGLRDRDTDELLTDDGQDPIVLRAMAALQPEPRGTQQDSAP